MRNKCTVTPAIDWVGHKTRNKTKYSLCRVIVHGDTGHRLSGTLDEEQAPGEEGEAGSQQVETDDPPTFQFEAPDQEAP